MIPLEFYTDLQVRLEKCEDQIQDLKALNENMVYNLYFHKCLYL